MVLGTAGQHLTARSSAARSSLSTGGKGWTEARLEISACMMHSWPGRPMVELNPVTPMVSVELLAHGWRRGRLGGAT